MDLAPDPEKHAVLFHSLIQGGISHCSLSLDKEAASPHMMQSIFSLFFERIFSTGSILLVYEGMGELQPKTVVTFSSVLLNDQYFTVDVRSTTLRKYYRYSC